MQARRPDTDALSGEFYMSGFLALLDDVAAIAKIAAASVDDISANAAKAGSKTIGVLIDDAAVTPNYVVGIAAARELPMIGKIAIGSLRNKALLIPALLALDYFLPIAITALLMIGGAYLCFEGAEKVWHKLFPSNDHHEDGGSKEKDPTALEEKRVAGAIKTDLILSAEIMTLALSMIETNSIWIELFTLIVVGIMITVLVYGVVAVIVKLDDFGVLMARKGRAVPKLLLLLTIVGTAAMLWVGGNIFIHGLHELGVHQPFAWISETAGNLAAFVSAGLSGTINWLATAFADGVFGFALGSAIVIIMAKVVEPLWNTVGQKS
jgi:predicted DNA repair protein MutK